MNNFIIFCNQRTGSEWLRNLLDSHPEIHCSSELLKLWGEGYTDREIFEKYFHQAKDKTYGCKVMYNDNVDLNDLKGLGREVKIIHLRRSALDRLVSAYVNILKDKTGRGAHSTTPEKNYKVEIPLDWFEHRLKNDNKYAIKYKNVGEISVNYDDLVDPTAGTLLDIQMRLGVTPASLKSNLVKQNPRKLEDFVINLDEIKRVYNKNAHKVLKRLYK